jgi:hypothetical protein
MSGRSTVQEAVRVIITRNPYLYRGMRMRVINYSAVARYIREEVESISGADVDPNTIVTAIMRLSNTLEGLMEEETTSPLKGSRLNLVTGISEITVVASPSRHGEIINKIVSTGDFDSYRFSIHQFSNGIKVITNSPHAEKVREELHGYQVDVSGDYAELHVRLPQGAEARPESKALVMDTLSQNGVHPVDAFFTENDVSLIVREEEASRAFDVLRYLSG